MQDLRKKKSDKTADLGSVDPESERLVVFVVATLAAVVLLPLHAAFIYGLFFTKPAFGIFALIIAWGVPLAIIDFFAFRWFRDNYSVFRWINRSAEAHRRRRGGL